MASNMTDDGGRSGLNPDAGNASSETDTREELGEVTGDLVAVFDSEDESEAMVVKGLLQSAGISAVVNSIDAHQDLFPGVGGVVVVVSRDQADEARQIITDAQSTPAGEE